MPLTLRFVIPIILLLIIGAGAWYWYVTPAGNACATTLPAPRIVAFGDSLVVGNGATTSGGFVTLLSQESGISIKNLGVSGDTTADAKERLASVLAQKPTITLLLLGGNDALRRLPQDEIKKNLSDIISTIQKGGSKVVLLGVIGGFPDPYASMFKDLSKTYDVTYVPNVLSGIIGHTDLMSDSVHPNQIGYQKIADRLLPVLERECANQ